MLNMIIKPETIIPDLHDKIENQDAYSNARMFSWFPGHFSPISWFPVQIISQFPGFLLGKWTISNVNLVFSIKNNSYFLSDQ